MARIKSPPRSAKAAWGRVHGACPVGGGSQDLEICGVCKGRLTQALESCLSEMKGTDEAGEVAS